RERRSRGRRDARLLRRNAACCAVRATWNRAEAMCFVATVLFWFESQAERGFANAKFGALAEHGGADALLFEKCAVGGVEVAEIDVVFADFDDTVVARDFGVLQGDVGAVAADDNARLFEDVRG